MKIKNDLMTILIDTYKRKKVEKMKVIDLLNKMANDKDYRPTVSFLGVTFTYNTIVGDYENDRDSNYGIFTNYVIENILNDEVGVIKEKKELEEKLD